MIEKQKPAAAKPSELSALLGEHAHSFEIDHFGWVIARKGSGSLRTQSVEAHLLHAILCELKAGRSAEAEAWKKAHEDLLEVRRQDLTAMQARIDALAPNAEAQATDARSEAKGGRSAGAPC